MLHSASQNARQWAFESNNSIDVTWNNKACVKTKIKKGDDFSSEKNKLVFHFA
jgi:hypothetical protein